MEPETQPTTEQETNYHLDRIASSLERIAETTRLQHEMSIDAIAKNNALSDDLGSALSGLLGSELFGGSPENDSETET